MSGQVRERHPVCQDRDHRKKDFRPGREPRSACTRSCRILQNRNHGVRPRLTVLIFGLSSILFSSLLLSCGHKADWIMFRGDQGRGYTSNPLFPPLAIKWKLQLQVSNERTRSFNPPVILEDTIYFGSSDGNLYALDIESGYMRWVFKSESSINSIPYADQENVYFGSNDGKVYAISRRDGQEQWSFETGHTVRSTITRYGDWIVFTSDVGATYFLSLDGLEQFRIPNPVWLYHTFQLYKDVMYFAPGPLATPFSFGAYDINSQAYLWIVDTSIDNATWYSFPALRGKYLYYATCGYLDREWQFVYYALDRETGGVIWQYIDESSLGEYIRQSPYTLFRSNLELLDYMAPSLWRDLVIYTSGDTVVRAFNQRNGRLVWQRGFDLMTSSAPTIAGDRIYFGLRGNEETSVGSVAAEVPGGESPTAPENRNPRLVCLSAVDGRFLWELDIEGAVLSAPVIAGKWIVFGTDKNYFYVLEEVY